MNTFLDQHTAKELLKLQQMEKRLVEACCEHPDSINKANELKLRYAINLARLSTFQPGAAGSGRNNRPDITVQTEQLHSLRKTILHTLGRSLVSGRTSLSMLEEAQASIPTWENDVEPTVQAILEDHINDFSREELNREIGTKTLVNVCGGGGGAGYVYIGAFEALEHAGYFPGYVIGSSIGAVLGLFRAKHRTGDYAEDINFAKKLSPAQVFRIVSLKNRFGLPGLFRLFLHAPIQERFLTEDNQPMKLTDLEIPFETVVAGVIRGAMGSSPEEYAREHHLVLDKMPGKLTLGRKIAAQLVRMLAFINPMMTREVIVGGDDLTADFDAVDAAGFSAAIPGILHYDIARNDRHMTDILEELFIRDELMCLVDGGVTNNVPARTAWNQVQDGKIGTRNCYYLAFDCFHPQVTLGHSVALAIEYAIKMQVASNLPFTHNVVRFHPTLSPVNLVPGKGSIDKSYNWGYQQMKQDIPVIDRFFEQVEWPTS